MRTVILKPLFHHEQECIGIWFEKDSLLQSSIQKKTNAKWSKTNGCWYVPCTVENYMQLKDVLEDNAVAEITGLREFLLQKRINDLSKNTDEPRKKIVRVPVEKYAGTSKKMPASTVNMQMLSKKIKKRCNNSKDNWH